jgi:hypothetical protein
LLQNRVIDLARRLECELRIEESSNRMRTDAPPTFSFSGSGQPLQVYDFLRYLERGDSRARFLDLNIAQRKNSRSTGITAHFSGTFTIPEIPELELSEMVLPVDVQAGETVLDPTPKAPVKPTANAGGAS